MSPEGIRLLVELLNRELPTWQRVELLATLPGGVEGVYRVPRPALTEHLPNTYRTLTEQQPNTSARDRPWQHTEAVVAILTSSPHPLTMPEILAELRHQRVDCSARTLGRWLPRLVADGTIAHLAGQGYATENG